MIIAASAQLLPPEVDARQRRSGRLRREGQKRAVWGGVLVLKDADRRGAASSVATPNPVSYANAHHDFERENRQHTPLCRAFLDPA